MVKEKASKFILEQLTHKVKSEKIIFRIIYYVAMKRKALKGYF
jgi:hypothetical protein